jgi:hypothetical protein
MDYMYVWVGGECVEYAVANVDSITFAKKESIVVKAKVPAFWGSDIYVYIWETQGVETGEYKAVKQGDWYVYTYNGTELNIIFKMGSGWKGNKYQTEDIYTKQSACFTISADEESSEKGTVTQVNCP